MNPILIIGGFVALYIVAHQMASFTDARGKRAHRRGIHEDGGFQERNIPTHVEKSRSATRGKVGTNHPAPARDFADAQSAGQPSWTYGPRKIQFWGSGAGYDWFEVAADLCRVDDGLPGKLDGRELTAKRHRIERIKSLGNAIVPQVAAEVLRRIKETLP